MIGINEIIIIALSLFMLPKLLSKKYSSPKLRTLYLYTSLMYIPFILLGILISYQPFTIYTTSFFLMIFIGYLHDVYWSRHALAHNSLKSYLGKKVT